MHARALRPLLFALPALLGLGACDDPSDSGRSGPPARLEVVAGDAQSDTVGQELPQGLVVRVTDEKGKPVRDQIVNFVVVSGGGRVFAGASQTDEKGEARERWTLGTVAADSQKLEARAVNTATGAPLVFATFRAVALPDAPATFAAVGSTGRAGAAGAALADSLAVRVSDRHGNPVPGVAVTWSVRSGGGTISPTSTPTNTQGTAKAQWALGPSTAAQEAQAAAASLPPIVFMATSAVPSGAVLEVVSGNGQTAPAGTALPQPLVVRARLADGRPLAGVQVTWVASSGTITPPVSTTGADGLAQASWTLPTAAGTHSATASASGATVTLTATAAAAAATRLVILGGNGQMGPAGKPVPVNPTVQAQDDFGNPVPGAQVTWAVAGGGQATAATATAPGASAVQWTLSNRFDVTQSLTASLNGRSPVLFTAVPTLVGSGATLALSGNGQSAPVATSLPDPLQVTATLPDGRPVVGAPVAWRSPGGLYAPASPADGTTDAAGRAQTRITFQSVAGTVRYLVTVGGLTADTVTLTALPRAPRLHSLSVQPTSRESIIVGSVVTAAVTLRDTFSNPTPGIRVGWRVGAASGSVDSAFTTSDAAGVARVRWTLGTRVDSDTIFADVPGIGTVVHATTPSPDSAVRAGVVAETNSVRRDTVYLPQPGASAYIYGVLLDRYGNDAQMGGISRQVAKTAEFESLNPEIFTATRHHDFISSFLAKSLGTGRVKVTVTARTILGVVTRVDTFTVVVGASPPAAAVAREPAPVLTRSPARGTPSRPVARPAPRATASPARRPGARNP